MVIEEALRLYRPTAGLGRKAIAADEIGGYLIPACLMPSRLFLATILTYSFT